MKRVLIQGGDRDRPTVLIAGGGIAALEALLALRALVRDRVAIDLIAPNRHLAYRPMTVAEPFGLVEPRLVSVAKVAEEHDARHLPGSLAEVDPERRTVRTAAGADLRYDKLLIATGARPSVALPGALTFWGQPGAAEFEQLLRGLEEGRIVRLVFAVPHVVKWPLALYELAFLTAAHLAARGIKGTELTFVTHESKPLGLFGLASSARIRELLTQAGVKLLTSSVPATVKEGRLELVGAGSLAADRVVALPGLDVPPLPGVPQLEKGFIPTDPHQMVDGLQDVYAAGDATWYPINQGGLAAQQADAAAEAIAAAVGARIDPRPFRPILRGILLTGSAPLHLRSDLGSDEGGSEAASYPLWWPPGKVAGRYLAPYLARPESDDQATRLLDDLDPTSAADCEQAEDEYRSGFELSLAAAEASARWDDYESALRWLDAAERLNLVLPEEYSDRRREWKRSLRT